jgi:N-acetyl-gamma-glutamyl-phosphate reductase
MSIRVSVIGATGYSGGELLSILARHPHVELAGVFSGKSGKTVPFETLHPSLGGKKGPTTVPYSHDAVIASRPDVVFLATPAEVSAEVAPLLIRDGVRVIDISGAFRLKSAAEFQKWYGFALPDPSLLEEAVYAVTELCGRELSSASLVANPGCYPTSVVLALKPVMQFVDVAGGIICDSASGVSGAGRQSSEAYSFCELATNFKAYNIGRHKHEPEMRQALGLAADSDFVFAAHLLPVIRGILTTIHVKLKPGADAAAMTAAYGAAYRDKTFIRVHPAGKLPELKDVAVTPRADIGFSILPDGKRAVIVSAIDNMLKGAASQAIQNMNVMFGLKETEGLA